MAIFAASTVNANGFRNLVIPLDDVGQVAKNSSPRAVRGFGMRVYPRSLFMNLDASITDTTEFGKSVAVGDLDADGVADWLISAPGQPGASPGSIELIYSRTYGGGFDPGAPPSFTGADINCLSWPYISQRPPTGIPAGRMAWVPWQPRTISGEGTGGLDKPIIIGDFNRDGRDDMACVAPGFNAGAGAAYIVFGHPTFGSLSVGNINNTPSSVSGLKLTGAAGQKLGVSHARFGDINNDGYDDWAIGASGYTYAGRAGCGAVAIVFGGANINGSRTLADVGDPAAGKLVPGLIIVGGTAGDAVGTYTVTAGDVDGDGNRDILVSAPGYSYPGDPAATPPKAARSKCGAVYLIYGGPALRPSDNVIDLGQVGRTVAGKIYIGPNANDQIGPVSAAGNVDQDKKVVGANTYDHDDFLIGNPSAGPRGVLGAGEAYLIYGSDRRVE